VTDPYDRWEVLDTQTVDQLLRIADGDSSFVQEVFGTYVTEGRRRLSSIDEAARVRDVNRLAKEAHGLKGASLSAGARQAAEVARDMEQSAKRDDFKGAVALLARLHRAYDLARGEMNTWSPGGGAPQNRI